MTTDDLDVIDARVAAMPSWMLRIIVRGPFFRSYWSSAWLELWRRDVLEPAEEEARREGAIVVDGPRGLQ